MSYHIAKINIFINEPGIYSGIDFQEYMCIDNVFFQGESNFDSSQVDAILIGLKDVIDDTFLKPFSRVKYIVSNTTGTDHIRTSRDIKIIHLKPEDVEEVTATSEFALALLLSIVRKIPFIDFNHVAERKMYRGVQLRGKRIGIFGMGRLGRKMASYAEALEMEYVGYDLESAPEDKIEILGSCDFISLHLPLREDTVDFISYKEFEVMERKPFLINTSRPQLINKAALIRALEDDLICGLAMDFINYDGSNVWDEELSKYYGEKLLMTPHIAGNTNESVAYTARVVVDKMVFLIQSGN